MVDLQYFLLFIISTLIFNVVVTFSQKLPSLESLGSDNISECHRCKVLADSFVYWLEKTSRGKFEGGDAAWEEAKLKSYNHSEIRLVEIQENLCSELKKHKDQCYAFAEETEQSVEHWWFKENPSSDELFTFLCINSLKYCCPKNHYGETCVPCPLDSHNIVCGGHGKCDGDGTRKGTGICRCDKGFSGINCDNCAVNYYQLSTGQCEPCHRACAECKGAGLSDCKSCQPGWNMDQGICVDINECEDITTCKPNQFCVNREGSYSCQNCDRSCQSCRGMGPNNCLSCDTNSVLWAGMCIEKNHKDALLISAFKKAFLYLGLVVITFFVFKTSKTLAALTVLVVAVFVYFSEVTMRISTADIFLNNYFR